MVEQEDEVDKAFKRASQRLEEIMEEDRKREERLKADSMAK